MSDPLSHFDSQIQSQEQLLRERGQEIENLRLQRDRLAELIRQREELQGQLRALDTDIALLERSMTTALHRFSGPSAPSSGIIAVPTPRLIEAPVTSSIEPKSSSLREEIRKVLRGARGALSGPEIARKILAGGYKTTSSNFPEIVKKTLTEMDDITHQRGRGYRLKNSTNAVRA